jgi:hypothetical protein
MGSPLNEPGRDSDERRHKVNLTRPFYMQTTEVIQGQWQAVTGIIFVFIPTIQRCLGILGQLVCQLKNHMDGLAFTLAAKLPSKD